MTQRDTNDIFFRLNRPQYSPNPEGIQSALAWALKPERVEEEWVRVDNIRKRVGYIYEKTPRAKNKLATIEVRTTIKNTEAPDLSIRFKSFSNSKPS